MSIPGQCTAEAYRGGLCKEQLAASQICALGVERPIMINASGEKERLEKNFIIFLLVLGKLDDDFSIKLSMYFSEQVVRPACKDAAVPFMCQYVFPLCDSTTGQLYLPTQQEFLQISQQVCSIEWKLATSYLGNNLPDDEKLPLQGGSGDGMEHCILQSIHYVAYFVCHCHPYIFLTSMKFF